MELLKPSSFCDSSSDESTSKSESDDDVVAIA
jgi:hypothetical protein